MVNADKTISCDCGFEARSADDAELVARAQRHAREAHSMEFTADQLLALTSTAAEAGGGHEDRRLQPPPAAPNEDATSDATREERA